jgi:hypothetical protein
VEKGRDEDDDEEKGWRLHQLKPLTDEEPTSRRKQVHDSRLHGRLECVSIILSSALLLSWQLLVLDFDEIESGMITINEKS